VQRYYYALGVNKLEEDMFMICAKTDKQFNVVDCKGCPHDPGMYVDGVLTKLGGDCAIRSQVIADPERCAACPEDLEPCGGPYSYEEVYKQYCKSCNGCMTRSCIQ